VLKRRATVPPEFNRGTDDPVDRKGFYYPACCSGEGISPELISIPLDLGTKFPRCPQHKRPTMWRLYLPVENVSP
jgi:hypothetical protein